MIAVGVTGTDTGVGKTVVACALVAALAERGARVGVMKPVETGVSCGATDSDAHRLAVASGSHDELSLIRPYAFPAPLAPLAAARLVGSAIDLPRLDRAFRAIADRRDVVVVEGAGGLYVPLTTAESVGTLFARWNVRLVIVAANRLGVLNHALLTLRAAERAQITVSAVVLNETGSGPADESAQSNATLLSELIGPIPVLRFPWLPHPGDHQALARTAETSALVAAAAPVILPPERSRSRDNTP